MKFNTTATELTTSILEQIDSIVVRKKENSLKVGDRGCRADTGGWNIRRMACARAPQLSCSQGATQVASPKKEHSGGSHTPWLQCRESNVGMNPTWIRISSLSLQSSKVIFRVDCWPAHTGPGLV